MTNLLQILFAIYAIEGGDKASVPYGIIALRDEWRQAEKRYDRSPGKSTMAELQRISAECQRRCENTVRNNFARWKKAGRPGCFYQFLGRVYVGDNDPVGRKNWIRNIKSKLRHSPCDCRKAWK